MNAAARSALSSSGVSPLYLFLKRGFDLLFSFTGLVLLSPILLIIAVAVKLESGGPVFFRGLRSGQNGRNFHILKFRSMRPNSSGPGITRAHDPRITAVGRILRKTKLDELPQLINVFRGEMSFVGPRPEDPRYVALYSDAQKQVLSLRPGITSPASIEYREEESMLSGADWERLYCETVLPRKLELDLGYVQHASLWKDLMLIFRTIACLLPGASRSGRKIAPDQQA